MMPGLVWDVSSVVLPSLRMFCSTLPEFHDLIFLTPTESYSSLRPPPLVLSPRSSHPLVLTFPLFCLPLDPASLSSVSAFDPSFHASRPLQGPSFCFSSSLVSVSLLRHLCTLCSSLIVPPPDSDVVRPDSDDECRNMSPYFPRH